MRKARDTKTAQRAFKNHEKQHRNSTAQNLGTHHDNDGAAPLLRVWVNPRADLARNERIVVRVKGHPGSFVATRGAVVEAALKVRGHLVVRRDDGSYHAVHQHHTECLADFSARMVSDLKLLLGVSS